MELHVEKQSKESNQKLTWAEVFVPSRIDAFTFKEFKNQVEEKLSSGEKFLAMNFTDTEFLSLLTIKFIISVAEELLNSKGQMALVGVSEKLKRQIGIYASIEPILVVSHTKQLSTQLKDFR